MSYWLLDGQELGPEHYDAYEIEKMIREWQHPLYQAPGDTLLNEGKGVESLQGPHALRIRSGRATQLAADTPFRTGSHGTKD